MTSVKSVESVPTVEAVGASHWRGGNEESLRFAEPVAKVEDALYCVRPRDWTVDDLPNTSPRVHQDEIGFFKARFCVVEFNSSVDISSGEGFLAIGSQFLDLVKSAQLEDEVENQSASTMMSYSESDTDERVRRCEKGFIYVPMEHSQYEFLRFNLGTVALSKFDEEIKAARGQSVTEAAKSALKISIVGPDIGFEERFKRKVAMSRIAGSQEVADQSEEMAHIFLGVYEDPEGQKRFNRLVDNYIEAARQG